MGDLEFDETGRFVWDPIENLEKRMKQFYEMICKKNGNECEFLQAFQEIFYSLKPLFEKHPKYLSVMETMIEPERVIMFRVAWIDDSGIQRVNRGFRVQYNSALGPYKGGLRFHPSVTLSIMKFLGLEQILKNALTSLPLGGGKGGADFDPKGKSDAEILRFCQSFMTSLSSHIGPDTDVPAGDIGVGGREIGYLFGQYKRLNRAYNCTLTGKSPNWGGSLIRPEATGYGAVYFAQCCLKDKNIDIKGLKCIISGSGNVAQYCCEKLIQLGAICLTLSDSSGYIYDSEGITAEKLKYIMDLKNVRRGRISEYTKIYTKAEFHPDKKCWCVPADAAFPCATQNEIEEDSAINLVRNGCKIVVEGANMPTSNHAVDLLKKKGVIFCPAKAANAGGVAVSGLEMSQNSMKLYWTREKVDEELKNIMSNVYRQAKDAAKEYGCEGDLQFGANIAGFIRVADSIIDQGCV